MLATTGCTHLQLEKDSVNQAYTVGDLEQQQVLNNLAMFVYNYNSLPYFSYPNQGATVVTDQGNAGLLPRGVGRSRPAPPPRFTPRHFGDFPADIHRPNRECPARIKNRSC